MLTLLIFGAMGIFGIVTLVKGKLTLSEDRIVEGIAARIVGVICLLPFPVAMVATVLYMLFSGQGGSDMYRPDPTPFYIHLGSAILCAAGAFAVGIAFGKPPVK